MEKTTVKTVFLNPSAPGCYDTQSCYLIFTDFVLANPTRVFHISCFIRSYSFNLKILISETRLDDFSGILLNYFVSFLFLKIIIY